MTEYQQLKKERKKAIAANANEWLKQNRVGLVSNVKPETRELFDRIHAQLMSENRVKSREETVIFLCQHFLGENT